MTTVLWVNGRLHDPEAPAISALDRGFTVGDGIFETVRVIGGNPMALTRHLARLQYSADRMGMVPVDAEQVREGVQAVLMGASEDIGRLRITVTSGAGPLGAVRSGGEQTVVVVAAPVEHKRSLTVVRAPWKRNERSPIAGIKTTSYAETMVVAAYAQSRGADEALMANTHGHLCEGITANVLIEREGEIVTPPLAAGCLPGITRGLALEWGSRAGIPVRVAAVGELEMAVLDEVVAGTAHLALTSTLRGIQQADRLDGVDLRPGPLLRGLITLFEAKLVENPDPAPPRSNSR